MKTITERQRQLINAVVAEGLSILPAGVFEKDLMVTEALARVAVADTHGFGIIFCGGTCLSKAHGLIQRMSEDLDFKVLVPPGMSRSARSRQLSQFKHHLVAHFSEMSFGVPSETLDARDENNYFSMMLNFQSAFPRVVSLRPEIQVEFTARPLAMQAQELQIRSMLDVAANLPGQPFAMNCVGIEETLAEKTLALLRRTAELLAGRNRDVFDARLVRHLYDIHEIVRLQPLKISAFPPKLFASLVAADAEQFGSQHPEFKENPKAQMQRALMSIRSDPVFREYYGRFLNDLVYGEGVEFDDAVAALDKVAKALLDEV
jgi:predicted nucleotidyltransferase component of viral defense system